MENTRKEIQEPSEAILDTSTSGPVPGAADDSSVHDRVAPADGFHLDESFCRLVLESIEDYAVFTTDPQGRVNSWNTGARRLLGYCDEEIMGQPAKILFTPEDRLLHVPDQELQAAVRDGRALDERYHQRKDGSLFWASGLVFPLYDDTQTLRGFTKVMRDMTAARQAQAELAQSQERFNLVVKATNDVVWDYDIENNRLWWNPNVEAMFGYSCQDLEAGWEAWRNRLHPDDRERVADGLLRFLESGGANWTDEYRFRRADGTYAFVHDQACLHTGPEGASRRLIGSMRDITAQKDVDAALKDLSRRQEATNHELAAANAQMLAINGTLVAARQREQEALEEQVRARRKVEAREREFRLLLETIPQLTWTTLPSGEVDYFNHRWYEYTGQTAGQAIGFGWWRAVHPDDEPALRQHIRQALHTGQGFEAEYRLRDASGTYQWFLSRGLPVKDAAGKVLRWFGTSTNIHTRKRMAEELEKRVDERTAELLHLNEELMRANAELEQFAYVASHDLREPLRKVRAFGSLLRTEYGAVLAGPGELYLDRMTAAVERMQHLMDDLLAFSRTGWIEEACGKTDLNGVVAKVAADLRERIVEAGGELVVETLPTLRAVSSQMEQLFLNLLTNAFKFSRPGVPPRVQVSGRLLEASELQAYELPPNSPHVAITISDNGIGFEPEYAEKIFVIFQRLHGRQEYEGTGIGLAICRRIVDNHQGRIWAQGRPGRGATFTLLLPVNGPQGH